MEGRQMILTPRQPCCPPWTVVGEGAQAANPFQVWEGAQVSLDWLPGRWLKLFPAFWGSSLGMLLGPFYNKAALPLLGGGEAASVYAVYGLTSQRLGP